MACSSGKKDVGSEISEHAKAIAGLAGKIKK